MADGKWIEGLTPDLSLEAAARQVLDVRLRVVQAYLPKAIHEADRDTENVHQLRVSTRRADAAVRIFAACLPGKVYRHARRRLRAIRRAAGAARDWDVFLDDLRERRQRQTQAEQPGFDALAGYALARRITAQVQLEDVGLEALPVFEEFIVLLMDAVRPPQSTDNGSSLILHGRKVLTTRLRKMECTADEDLTDYANMHRVRIEGKRLRYAMEVFVSCFPAAFRDDLYPRIEAMQEALGKANDSHVAVGDLTALRERMKGTLPQEWKHWQPGVNGLLRFHQRRLPQERRRFLKLWEQWRGPETTALWDSVLARQTETVRSTHS